MSTYVLVHGSWHGSWCWQKVIGPLEEAGHRVVTIDLPGHGGDGVRARDITLESYVGCVTEVLDALEERAILVGHSRGGVVISQSAEARPEKIERLVYLAAYLLRSGETMFATAPSDTESLIVSHLEVNEAEGWHMVRERGMRECLYADCTEEDLALAPSKLEPEANMPAVTPVRLSEGKFGRVPRVYIECLQDRVVSLSMQRKMQAKLPCERVFSLDTGHSPFLSAPEELAECLLAVARETAPSDQSST
jgi:pimeloyl-ACP methyl ester carboxylesterase